MRAYPCPVSAGCVCGSGCWLHCLQRGRRLLVRMSTTLRQAMTTPRRVAPGLGGLGTVLNAPTDTTNLDLNSPASSLPHSPCRHPASQAGRGVSSGAPPPAHISTHLAGCSPGASRQRSIRWPRLDASRRSSLPALPAAAASTGGAAAPGLATNPGMDAQARSQQQPGRWWDTGGQPVQPQRAAGALGHHAAPTPAAAHPAPVAAHAGRQAPAGDGAGCGDGAGAGT